MEYTLITYGAGDLLNTLFNAIASILNSKTGSLYQPLVRIGLMLGLLWATLAAILGNKGHMITHWMVPFYVLLALFFAPTCILHIKDPTNLHPPYTVNHVPWGLGALAGTVSKIGDSITRKIESVFSLPDDLKYHKTGSVMASNLIAESRVFHITDADLAETMREFVNQCVVYDALIGFKYTMEDLKKSDNIWGLVSQNPSPARSFTFKAPGKGQKAEICTCQEGVKKLKTYLDQDVENAFQWFGNKIFGRKEDERQKGANLINPSAQLKQYLPIAFSYMAQMANSAADVMKQQMMIYSVIDAIENKSSALGNAPNFAVRRAYLQQRANQETLAGIAAQKLIAMKNVMEAMIYAAFIFILPLAMIPMGWKFVGRWIGLLLWVQLWPPLYAVLNFIMNAAARSKGIGLVTLGTGSGITIANSVGFTNLHADMAAQAGFMSFAVGALAYAIVKGGAGSFVHLASHLAQPATAAAASASEALTTGNYSFGNVSQGTLQAHNTTFGQQQWSPSYASGSFTQHDGVVSRVTSADGSHLVNVATSNLRSSLNWGESMSNAYTEQAAHAAQVAQNQMKAAGYAEAEAMRNVIDLSMHQGRQQSSAEGYDSSQSVSQNESFTKLNNLVDRFAKDNNISREAAVKFFANASAGISTGLAGQVVGVNAEAKAGVEGSWSASDRDNYAKAIEYSKQSQFQEALQGSLNAVKDQKFSASDDTGTRYAESVNAATDRANQLRQEAAASLQKSESFSKMASWTKQNASSISANLNQEYVDWLQTQSLPNSSGAMGITEVETILSSRPDLDLMYQRRFLEETLHNPSFKQEPGIPSSEHHIDTSYENLQTKIDALSSSFEGQVRSQASQDGFGQGFQVNTQTKTDVESALMNHQRALEEQMKRVEQAGKARTQQVTQRN